MLPAIFGLSGPVLTADERAFFRDDDPAFALMRAERRPLDLAETPTYLPGVLALPMADHGALAVLALAALQARATDAEVEHLRIKIAELHAVIAGWQQRASA